MKTNIAYSFPHYLLSKQSVDDRALNRVVLETLKAALADSQTLSITEVGAGIGTMLARLLRWKALPPQVNYTLVDEMQENIDFARQWLPRWGAENGWQTDSAGNDLRLSVSTSVPQSVTVHFIRADVFDFIHQSPPQADLLIAHAFLDLLPMPQSLGKLFSLIRPGGLAWMTVNFDGVTSLEPPLDPKLDAKIERLYHQTMDTRPSGGDSLAGRHLFGHVKKAGGEILSAGASDWVVYPLRGQYPAEEAYFLHFILHFFEESLGSHPALEKEAFSRWLTARRAQVERGELVYVAHQLDFLAQTAQLL